MSSRLVDFSQILTRNEASPEPLFLFQYEPIEQSLSESSMLDIKQEYIPQPQKQYVVLPKLRTSNNRPVPRKRKNDSLASHMKVTNIKYFIETLIPKSCFHLRKVIYSHLQEIFCLH